MGRPRVNNLNKHLQWARESDAFIPSGNEPSSLPTPPAHSPLVTPETIDDSSDSDIELIAAEFMRHRTQSFDPNAGSTQQYLTVPQQSSQANMPKGPSSLVPLSLPTKKTMAPISVINPATPAKSALQALPEDEPVFLLSSPADFTLSQAPVNEVAPRPEIGSLFTEKIALLERKIRLLSSILDSHKVAHDTSQIDASIKEVEGRIERFDDDEGINSSPICLPAPRQTSLGLPQSINNDAFDSDEDLQIVDDFNIVSVAKSQPIQTMSPALPTNSPRTNEQCELELNEFYAEPMQEFNQFSSDAAVPNECSSPAPTPAPASAPAPAWTKELMHILRARFGLHGFRANQCDAVNTTLSGQDVCVLMPTGGGKSLCYQLPALVKGGKTHGTTIVISPLISLMQDQVYHLKNRDINAEMLNSRLNSSERQEVFGKLFRGELELLYLSPEMLSASGAMRSALQKLYGEGNLARIVIDEAHCVSSWGHDFRPEYMELTKVKEEFPTTPIMALTATANDRVLLDIVNCLRNNPRVLKQSFNRPNLFYEVRHKTTSVVQDIAGICKMYTNKSGIVYCNSKKNCEETSRKLNGLGIKASFYHAGMEQDRRANVQTEWQQGRTSVVCATIAFGMGIDKPDVRYVVHMTVPRNIEGYYQETGRAGRDGKASRCVLFYNYHDVQILKKMISQDDIPGPIKDHYKSLLDRVMQYCENRTDCRRRLVLQYFNEDFDPRYCHQQCDNCRAMRGQKAVCKDMTLQSLDAVKAMQQIGHGAPLTTQQFIEGMIGRSTTKMKVTGYDKLSWFGCLRDEGLNIVERLVHHLISQRIFEEYSQYNHSRFPQTYIRLGAQAQTVLRGSLAIQLVVNEKETEAAKRPVPSGRFGHKRARY